MICTLEKKNSGTVAATSLRNVFLSSPPSRLGGVRVLQAGSPPARNGHGCAGGGSRGGPGRATGAGRLGRAEPTPARTRAPRKRGGGVARGRRPRPPPERARDRGMARSGRRALRGRRGDGDGGGGGCVPGAHAAPRALGRRRALPARGATQNRASGRLCAAPMRDAFLETRPRRTPRLGD